MAQLDRDSELFIVFNPGSGSHDADARSVIEQALAAADRRHRFVPIQGGDVSAACREAARLASKAGGMLVCVGGDGTVSTAAQAAHAQGCAFGVVAQGTFNIFAREHGLPLDTAQAVQCVLQGEVSDVQVGMVNQQLFLVNASVGLYAKLLADREEAKERFGRKRWVALVAALNTLFGWRSRLSLDAELDGDVRRIVTSSLFICNNQLQLERVGIDSRTLEQVGQGRLCGIVSCPLHLLAKLRLVARAIVGRLGSAPEIDAFTLKSLTVASRHARRLRVGLDGEVRWMELPLRITVAPRPLRLVLPRSPANTGWRKADTVPG